jgi:L-alanine-DL-glutamate epimerase-like enolase superfamily enzyme
MRVASIELISVNVRIETDDGIVGWGEASKGHQQTAYLMTHDILKERIPIFQEPTWGVPDGAGLGVDSTTRPCARQPTATSERGSTCRTTRRCSRARNAF